MPIDFTAPPTAPPTFGPPPGGGSRQHRRHPAAISALSSCLSQASDYDKDPAPGGRRRRQVLRTRADGPRGPRPRQLHPRGSDRVRQQAGVPARGELGKALGPDKVCLFVKADRIPRHSRRRPGQRVTVATSRDETSRTAAQVVLGVSHKLGAMGEYGGCSTTSAPPETERSRSTCCSSTRPGSCRCTCTHGRGLAPIVGRRRRRRPAAAHRPQPEPLARRPRLQPLPSLAHRLRRTTRPPSPSTCPPCGARRPSSCRCGGRSTATGTPWTASPPPATVPSNFRALTERRRVRCGRSVATGVRPCWRSTACPTPDAPDIDQPLLGVVEDSA